MVVAVVVKDLPDQTSIAQIDRHREDMDLILDVLSLIDLLEGFDVDASGISGRIIGIGF